MGSIRLQDTNALGHNPTRLDMLPLTLRDKFHLRTRKKKKRDGVLSATRHDIAGTQTKIKQVGYFLILLLQQGSAAVHGIWCDPQTESSRALTAEEGEGGAATGWPKKFASVT